jgi:hypothetical protein
MNKPAAISRAGVSFRSRVPKANAGDESVFIAYLPIRLASAASVKLAYELSLVSWAPSPASRILLPSWSPILMLAVSLVLSRF